jgi:hypothetical protein
VPGFGVFDITERGERHERSSIYAPSLDRLDPTAGYSRENCRLVSVGINFAMNRWGLDTYLELAEASVNQLRRTTGDDDNG